MSAFVMLTLFLGLLSRLSSIQQILIKFEKIIVKHVAQNGTIFQWHIKQSKQQKKIHCVYN